MTVPDALGQSSGDGRVRVYSRTDPVPMNAEEEDDNPPLYSGPVPRSVFSRNVRQELRRMPSTAQQLVEHTFALSKTTKSASQRPWLELKVFSYATSSESSPTLLEGKPIDGLIELDLEKPDDIRQITVVFKGMIITKDVGDKRIFYQHEVRIWDRSMGDPHLSPSTSSPPSFRTRLCGRYVWPFKIDLQSRFASKTREMNDFKLAKEERLPPNLHGLNDLPLIDYQITAHVKRASLLRPNSSLSIPVVYLPEIPVPRYSTIRENAYAEEAAYLPGPDADDGGWYKTSPVRIKGHVFKTRKVAVDYSLYIALPMTFTRGSIIPLYLVLNSTNKHAVALLANPRAIRIGINRVMTVPSRFSGDVGPHQIDVDAGSKSCRVAWKTLEPEYAASSSIREVYQGDTDTFEHVLYGEITLPPGLTPSFTFGQFSVRYYVDVFAPRPTGFEPSTSGRLGRTEVTISATIMRGPQPRSLLPVGEIPDVEEEFSEEILGAFCNAFLHQSNMYGSMGQ